MGTVKLHRENFVITIRQIPEFCLSVPSIATGSAGLTNAIGGMHQCCPAVKHFLKTPFSQFPLFILI